MDSTEDKEVDREQSKISIRDRNYTLSIRKMNTFRTNISGKDTEQFY